MLGLLLVDIRLGDGIRLSLTDVVLEFRDGLLAVALELVVLIRLFFGFILRPTSVGTPASPSVVPIRWLVLLRRPIFTHSLWIPWIQPALSETRLFNLVCHFLHHRHDLNGNGDWMVTEQNVNRPLGQTGNWVVYLG